MRREVITRATQRIIDDLVSSGVETMFEEASNRARQASKEDRDFVSFEVFQKYSIATSSYGEAEHAIAAIMGISPLFSAETWQRLSVNSDPAVIFELRRNVFFARNDLPKIVKLLEQEHVAAAKTGENLPVELRGKTGITFILPEEEHEYSSPARLIAALEAITNLYGVFCTLENQSEGDLIVLACDSGSDKSFDFLGVAKLMEEVRKLVVAIWDRRVFYRHMHASQCIALIAESLPVIAQIETLKQSRALEPEQAELLKRKTLLGATQFLESGIYIQDMVSQGQSPRQLMRPEPKLLAAPAPTTPTNDGSVHSTSRRDGNSDALSEEDIAELTRLLGKARLGHPSAQPPSLGSAPRKKR